MKEKQLTHLDLSWWTQNFNEQGNVRGVKITDDHLLGPGGGFEADTEYSVEAAYADFDDQMLVAVKDRDGDIQDISVNCVEPVMADHRRASGLVLKKALNELNELLRVQTRNHRDFLENVKVDTDPENPRTYLPAYAWPEYWHVGQKLRVVDSMSSEGIQNLETVCEFVMFNRETAIVFFRDNDGKRHHENWSDLLPLEDSVFSTDQDGGQGFTPSFGTHEYWRDVKHARFIAFKNEMVVSLYPDPNEVLTIVTAERGRFRRAMFGTGPKVTVVNAVGNTYDLDWYDLEPVPHKQLKQGGYTRGQMVALSSKR